MISYGFLFFLKPATSLQRWEAREEGASLSRGVSQEKSWWDKAFFKQTEARKRKKQTTTWSQAGGVKKGVKKGEPNMIKKASSSCQLWSPAHHLLLCDRAGQKSHWIQFSKCLQFQCTLYGMTPLKRFLLRQKVFLCDMENSFVTEGPTVAKFWICLRYFSRWKGLTFLTGRKQKGRGRVFGEPLKRKTGRDLSFDWTNIFILK